MPPGRYAFDRFVLDADNRRLTRDGAPLDVSGRYLDALVLLAANPGKLVTKDRFMDEVWRGVPVTDEALTQCIRTLRRVLEDDAARPRFIETVPRHGYRFIAAAGPPGAEPPPARPGRLRPVVALGSAGTLGAGLAGLVGGLLYGSLVAGGGAGSGGLSTMLVLVWLTVVTALVGGTGVAFGIAAAERLRGPAWAIAGGALGGFLVGGVVKLLGLDAFNLLLGRAPGDIAGAPEGLLLGTAVGLGRWLSMRGPAPPLRRTAIVAGLAGGTGGFLVALLGGRLMAGSLDLLASSFPGSRLDLGPLGVLFGETGLGPVTRAVTATLEGALFGACIVGAMTLARRGRAMRTLADPRPHEAGDASP